MIMLNNFGYLLLIAPLFQPYQLRGVNNVTRTPFAIEINAHAGVASRTQIRLSTPDGRV